MKRKERKGLDAKEIAVFCEQVSLILGSNVALEDGIQTLAGEEGSSVFRVLDEAMRESSSFSAAVAATNVFPPYMTGMVRVAEETGEMERVMRALADHYHHEAAIRRQIANAIRYPLTLVVIMTLVIVVLVFRVLPVFKRAFESLGGGLPGYAGSMMRIGQGAGLLVFSTMLLVLITVGVFWLALRDGKHPGLRRALIERLPVVRRLQKQIAAQKFASVFSMVLASGFPFEMALDLIPMVYDDEPMRELMRHCGKQVMEGASVADVIGEAALFEPLDMQMIRAGFAAGQADVAFERIARMQTQDIEEGLQRVIAWIEPALVVFLGAMIGAILLAVMMPLAGVLSAMG